jgi:hypothetical protein
VGPPPTAIHGLGRLNRHPCRFTPRLNIGFRPAWSDGAPKIKSQINSRSTADQQQINSRSTADQQQIKIKRADGWRYVD